MVGQLRSLGASQWSLLRLASKAKTPPPPLLGARRGASRGTCGGTLESPSPSPLHLRTSSLASWPILYTTEFVLNEMPRSGGGGRGFFEKLGVARSGHFWRQPAARASRPAPASLRLAATLARSLAPIERLAASSAVAVEVPARSSLMPIAFRSHAPSAHSAFLRASLGSFSAFLPTGGAFIERSPQVYSSRTTYAPHREHH